MGVYDPLTSYLKDLDEDSWNANFAEIERIIRRTLPTSAYEYRPWWANQRGGNHSQSKAWQEAGWETREVDLAHHTVRFERTRRKQRVSSDAVEKSAVLEDLFRRASDLTGNSDRDRLIEMALNALIQREAARQLARLGGTMPDLTVPSRDRPSR
ncbi:DUF2191 domain-containing protein [Novosphingobium sp. CCH12-A3]|uniref:DUF7662 domain-containing protein n=1 Tax=Novosphingobium sp. CCH12-A3 TaxID=1768752 RepID=UPI0007813DA8|nr:DUF2191 domain-containing protein [Novosphingobium sp. CCH12-A3]